MTAHVSAGRRMMTRLFWNRFSNGTVSACQRIIRAEAYPRLMLSSYMTTADGGISTETIIPFARWSFHRCWQNGKGHRLYIAKRWKGMVWETNPVLCPFLFVFCWLSWVNGYVPQLSTESNCNFSWAAKPMVAQEKTWWSQYLLQQLWRKPPVSGLQLLR